jgi:hypothetical protein
MDEMKERDEQAQPSQEQMESKDMVDGASEESFPASDPPSLSPRQEPRAEGPNPR